MFYTEVYDIVDTTYNGAYRITLFHFKKMKRIIADIAYKHTILSQCVLANDVSYVSYTAPVEHTNYYLSILFSFLQEHSYPVPNYFNSIIPYNIVHNYVYSTQDKLIFQTVHNKFIANIGERQYGYYITIGGKDFMGCIEITIGDNSTHIAQIYSEPECGLDTELSSDGTIDMIKASLQLCQALFGVNKFILDDNSNIECGDKNYSKKPPRTMKKPLSLIFLTIAKYCKTWYELHFNAYIENVDMRKKYYESVNKLDNTINLPYDKFAKQAHIDDTIYEELKSYYYPSDTWFQFIKRIPKNRHCILLSWVPSYFESLMGFHPAHHKWTIQLDTNFQYVDTPPVNKQVDTCKRNISTIDKDHPPIMSRTEMVILTNRRITTGGWNRNIRKKTKKPNNTRTKHIPDMSSQCVHKRKTHKNRYAIQFSNTMYNQVLRI